MVSAATLPYDYMEYNSDTLLFCRCMGELNLWQKKYIQVFVNTHNEICMFTFSGASHYKHSNLLN